MFDKFYEHQRKQASIDRENKIKVAKDVAKYLKYNYNCKVYLYGSLLREGLMKYNDIDIMVEGLNYSFWDYITFSTDIERRFLPYDVDIHQKENMKDNFLENENFIELEV